jgi:arginase
MAMLHATGRLAALDVVELNPLLDVRGRTARQVVELLAVLFGRRPVRRNAELPRGKDVLEARL